MLEKRQEPQAGAIFPVIDEDRRHPRDPGFFVDEEYNIFYGPFIVGKIPKEYYTHDKGIYKPEKITCLRFVEKGVFKVAEYDYEFISNK